MNFITSMDHKETEIKGIRFIDEIMHQFQFMQ